MNEGILAQPCVRRHAIELPSGPTDPHSRASSQSTYTARMEAEQMQIRARLLELGVNSLGQQLDSVHISSHTDAPGQPSSSPQMIPAKRRALERWSQTHRGAAGSLFMPAEEADAIEQRAHQAQLEREKQHYEKSVQRGHIMPGEQLTQKQINERLWAFMNYKPTESDEEYDDDDDDAEDDDTAAHKFNSEDPSTWFDDYDEDQGHQIIEPDELENIIQVEQPGNWGVMKIDD
ncbi:hypothetical protein AURDEDRAFT_52660 [Auricularia subglabra TFB-10046 SS5]|nr:hypothetical protein AURDEDRAFT_52660 [Auricularia subglabra TFB-10046 SS5]